jgi:hypothetical protein
MSGLELNLAFEALNEGSAEERAAFGLLSMACGEQVLTEGFDHYARAFRLGPLVSGYHAAQWFAWNWWRLRWEGRSSVSDWAFAHHMATIGEGYAWPNVRIWSDGIRTALISDASVRPDAKPFRYVGAHPIVISSALFERALDEFLPKVIARLRDQSVPQTNLDKVWEEVLAERSDSEIAKRRRLEALMGRDPDSIDDDAIENLVSDCDRLGEEAVNEVAAQQGQKRAIDEKLSARFLEEVAAATGFRSSQKDVVALDIGYITLNNPNKPAWVVGSDVARLLRAQEKLGVDPVDDQLFAQMCGTSVEALTNRSISQTPISYALDDARGSGSRVVLTAGHHTGRRFALARVLGDRLMYRRGALFPATQGYTYRQKAQRAFAAELLVPFEALFDMLSGDYSEDGQQDAADHFGVSPMVVNTILKNRRIIERDLAGEDGLVLAA